MSRGLIETGEIDDAQQGRDAGAAGASGWDDRARTSGEAGLASGDAHGGEISGLPGGGGALYGSGAPGPLGGGTVALRGGSATASGRGVGASPGDDAPAARGGGVAVGVGGAPPAYPADRQGAPGGDGSAGPPNASAAAPARAAAGGGRRKRTLGALALGLCAAGLAVGSGADFSARTANPANVFSAGSLSMQNSKDGSAILNATGMKPGAAPKTGLVDIQNTGSVSGRFTISRDQLTNTDLHNDNPIQFAAKVVIGIVDCGKFATVPGPYGPVDVTPTCGDSDDRTISLGPLSAQTVDLDLGTYDGGEKHRYQFEASLDSSAGNEFAGDSSSARYVFDAKQTP